MVPLRFDQLDHKEFQDCSSVGMTKRETVGITYEFFERLRTAAFSDGER